MKIRIFYEEVGFRLKDWKNIKKIIEEVISKEKKVSGDLNFIFTNDKHLVDINRKFLNRNYFTDVISFDYSSGKIISGEVYISTETVKNNSINYKVSYREEIFRVLIHGVLHLCGYDDKSETEVRRMRRMEDYWIKIWRERIK